jgi:hypothetical protein
MAANGYLDEPGMEQRRETATGWSGSCGGAAAVLIVGQVGRDGLDLFAGQITTRLPGRAALRVPGQSVRRSRASMTCCGSVRVL